MFEGNDYTTLEVIDTKLSTTLNNVNWALTNVKDCELSKIQQKTLRRALLTAQEGLSKAIKVIDGHTMGTSIT